MIKQFFIILLFTTGVWANDIYMQQTPENPQADKPAFIEEKPVTSEKELISPPQTEFCSVIAGCYEAQ